MRAFRRPGDPDFTEVIRTLNSAGLSQRVIARLLQVGVSAVCRWRAGDTQPNYSNGRALLLLIGDEPKAR